MFCASCGTQLPEGVSFCPNCGARVAAQTPVQPQPAPQYRSEPAPQAQPYVQPQPAPQAQPYVQPQPAPQAQPYVQAQPYAQPYQTANTVYVTVNQAPVARLATNRKLVKLIFFSILTFGIYGIVFFTNISTSINTAASRYDGKKTMNFCLVFFIFSWLTMGIVPFVWIIKRSSRIGNELRRRGINYTFGAGQFWLWCFLGSLFLVGPFIYAHKLAVSMNLICGDYNQRG